MTQVTMHGHDGAMHVAGTLLLAGTSMQAAEAWQGVLTDACWHWGRHAAAGQQLQCVLSWTCCSPHLKWVPS